MARQVLNLKLIGNVNHKMVLFTFSAEAKELALFFCPTPLPVQFSSFQYDSQNLIQLPLPPWNLSELLQPLPPDFLALTEMLPKNSS